MKSIIEVHGPLEMQYDGTVLPTMDWRGNWQELVNCSDDEAARGTEP